MIHFFLLFWEGSVNRLLWQPELFPGKCQCSWNAKCSFVNWANPNHCSSASLPCMDPQGAASWGMANWELLGLSVPTLSPPVLFLPWPEMVLVQEKPAPGSLPLHATLVIPLHLLTQLFSCCPENKTKSKSPSCAWDRPEQCLAFGFFFL